jgi:hypothetical protein
MADNVEPDKQVGKVEKRTKSIVWNGTILLKKIVTKRRVAMFVVIAWPTRVQLPFCWSISG